MNDKRYLESKIQQFKFLVKYNKLKVKAVKIAQLNKKDRKPNQYYQDKL
jgi:hypothetical protein